MQVTRASCGLLGEAKEWFSSWQPVTKDWENFKVEISHLYPPKKNLSEKLRKASLYTSDDAATFCEYARKKISLLKALNFTLPDAQLLEIVIGDIRDVHVKTAAFNSNVKTISDLLLLLDNYKKFRPKSSRSQNVLKRPYPLTELKDRICYKCNQPGHFRRHCPEETDSSLPNTNRTAGAKKMKTGNKLNCDFCGKFGHEAETCYAKIKRDKNFDRKPSAKNI